MNKVEAFFKNPFADFNGAQTAPLKIQKAVIGTVPDSGHGWVVALWLYCFMAFYALGPGVCVWLALSELMPTRIRSNGMSIALLINQVVSTTMAAIFLPVGKYGYSTMFFLFAGFTVIYLITAAFFLPETKGKTLEEIEEYFEGRGNRGVDSEFPRQKSARLLRSGSGAPKFFSRYRFCAGRSLGLFARDDKGVQDRYALRLN